MVLIATAGLSVGGYKRKHFNSFNLTNPNTLANTKLNQYKEFKESTNLNQKSNIFYKTGTILQSITDIKDKIGFYLKNKETYKYIYLIQEPQTQDVLVGFSIQPNIIKETDIFIVDKYQAHVLFTKFIQLDNTHTAYNSIYTFPNGTLYKTADLELIDLSGPRVINLIPSSGSTYNNPLTNISFTLIDTEHTRINPSGTNFFIDNMQVIRSGINITPPLSGTLGFEELNDYTYSFYYTPNNPFNPDTIITLSGTAVDTNIPPNNSTFNYNFRVWKTDSLQGLVVGVADTEPPYITNLFPAKLETEVNTNTNISIDIIDDHTGVNQNSIILKLEDILIVSGVNLYNQTEYPTTITTVSSGKGYRYLINPTYDLPFNSIINTYIYAEDLYTPAVNIMEDSSYSFITYNNAYLTASGLQMLDVESNWINLDNSISYEILQSGINLRVTYLNLENTGIDLSESNITYNGTLVSGVNFTEIINGYSYLAEFNIIPDYKSDCNLTFHIVRSGQVNGITIYNDYHTELLFGAEVCYNPDNNFKYSSEIPIFIKVEDAADYPTLDSNFYKITTQNQPKNDLYSSIIGLPSIYNEIIGQYIANNPFFEYGKVMDLELSAKDYAGNEVIYKWSFKIENKKE